MVYFRHICVRKFPRADSYIINQNQLAKRFKGTIFFLSAKKQSVGIIPENLRGIWPHIQLIYTLPKSIPLP